MSKQILDEKSIFNIARRIDGRDARWEYLDQVCGTDPEVHSRVVALLEIYESEQTFLESPLNVINVALDLPTPDLIGTHIGSYKLLEQIGEGGMGVVYMAEQKKPVRRLVALKIVKPGMDSQQVIARFDAERQSLAMMEHPNIARIIDAGTTELGRPYFVMELVRGIPINEFCDQKCLSLRERLDLFLQVCQAVQHAHQKGIIHRDLKPTSVLVTMLDVLAVPKVIDFGIAKAFGPQLTEHTQVTAFAQFIGTPQYMSPEQAEMNQLGVDTRSDVYSLGVMLYEWLTGTTPFNKDMLKKTNLATASDDMSVKFWDVDCGQERFAPTLIGLNLPVHRVEWSSDGKLLVTSELSEKRDSGKTTVWDLPSGLKQRELVGHFALALSPDGRILATTNWDKMVRLWDIASGQERTILRGHTEIVPTGMFSRDGTLLATGSNDMTVRIWNLDEGLEKMAFNRFRHNAVHSVSWSPDHKLLAMAYEDGETHLWEPKSRCLRGAFKSGTTRNCHVDQFLFRQRIVGNFQRQKRGQTLECSDRRFNGVSSEPIRSRRVLYGVFTDWQNSGDRPFRWDS